jgi:DHA2 family multidrug resistance protein
VPIGIAATFLVTGFLHDPPGMRRKPQSIDWAGISLLTIGLASLQYVLEEGRENDWFNSTTIVRLSVVATASLAGMLWWELSPRNKHPVIDFHVLRNRDLAGSIFLFIALGFGLYGGVFLFPLFTQNLLHFTPTETGLTLMPGGIATAVAAIICGRMLNGARPMVDARLLIYTGVTLFVVAMWRLGHLTVEAGEPEARFALIIRGLGLGFLFTPINNVAYANLKPSQAQQASGLINLARQLGGSFGIAIITTFLDHQVALHRATLTANTYIENPQFMARQNAAVAGLIARGFSPAQAKQGALAILDQSVMRQATMLSYNDAWMLILATFVLIAPAILILRRPRGRAPAGEAH